MERKIMALVANLAIIATAKTTDRIPSKGFAMFSTKNTFHPHYFTRKAIGKNDILIKRLYAEICRSDLHTGWDEQKEQELYATCTINTVNKMARHVLTVGKGSILSKQSKTVIK